MLQSFTKCEFHFILFIFYTLFCSLSQNKPGRQKMSLLLYWVTYGKKRKAAISLTFDLHYEAIAALYFCIDVLFEDIAANYIVF